MFVAPVDWTCCATAQRSMFMSMSVSIIARHKCKMQQSAKHKMQFVSVCSRATFLRDDGWRASDTRWMSRLRSKFRVGFQAAVDEGCRRPAERINCEAQGVVMSVYDANWRKCVTP